VTPAEAAALIVEHVRPLPVESRPLLEALGAVLSADVRSPIDLPAWDNSAMDGYAVAARDARPGAVLRVVESVAAGQFPTRALAPGEATRVFTGAPVPNGADTVIRQEDTAPAGTDEVTINDARDAGRNVRPRGEDLRAGALVFPAGTPLGPPQLGVLASIAHEPVAVHRRPGIAFFASGEEIVDLDRRDDILAGRKVASSNSYTLTALIRQAGAEVRSLGIARDTKESLREHLRRAPGADLLVTTGGVSVGEHDLVRAVLTELGCEMKLWRIRMRPGAPLGFGIWNDTPWIGLPGNPVSAMVTFELCVRPAIRRLLGHALPFRRTVPVVIDEDVTLVPRLRHYLRAVVAPSDSTGTRRARLTGPQGSGILTSMARANALVIVPEDRPQVRAGEELSALLLDDPVHTAEATF
jgi:molybdopterin molybdotransferase